MKNGENAARHAEAVRMPVLVTNDFPPHHGGIQRLMSRLAQELTLQNKDVVVVAPRIDGSDEYDRQQRFKIIRYGSGDRLRSFAGMTIALLQARIGASDPLTIASMWFPAGLAACLLPRFVRGRLGVLAHGSEIAPQRGGVRRYLMRFVFARAEVIIANSEFTRGLLAQAGVQGRIAVVNPGIDAERILPNRASDPTILSVGRLIARKGFDTVISALPAVVDAFPNVRYEIVGSGPQQAELEALASRLGVRHHVAFLGAVADDEMRRAYARAWCFALPARAIGGDVEGFGVVYLEAALADLPTIGGSGSGAEDAIAAGRTGLLVDGMSAPAVAAALIDLLGDPPRAAAMGVSGRERALADFTWKHAAAGIADLFERPLNPP